MCFENYASTFFGSNDRRVFQIFVISPIAGHHQKSTFTYQFDNFIFARRTGFLLFLNDALHIHSNKLYRSRFGKKWTKRAFCAMF